MLIQVVGVFYLVYRVMGSFEVVLEIGRLETPVAPLAILIAQGFPAAVNMMTVAAGIFIITWFISFFSKEGVAAYGIATALNRSFSYPPLG